MPRTGGCCRTLTRQFAWKIVREVEEKNARVVVIDSLNGFLRSMPGEGDLALHLHELLASLNQKGVNTFLILTQRALLGEGGTDDIDAGYLADTLVILRYFEAEGAVHRVISVLKKRSGEHEHTIRELWFGPQGIQLGEALVGFKGILSGIPDFIRVPVTCSQKSHPVESGVLS